jgi:glycosyltransferase involved in cell wall biosynthesis
MRSESNKVFSQELLSPNQLVQTDKAKKLNYHPKISIIIPVYQEEKILPFVLKNYNQSLLRKYLAELIVSDGGSSDNSVEIARNFAHKVVVHQDSRRQTIAEGRNRGAEIAQGDLLVFINADTVPSDIEKFLSYILNWHLNAKDEIALAVKVRGFPGEEIWKDRLFYFFHNNFVRLLNFVGIGMGRGECQVVRKEAFWRVGGYNPEITAGEDFDLYKKLRKIGKIRFVDEVYVYESLRRFRKYGYFHILVRWLLNGLSVMLLKKSYSSDWEPVR